MLLQKISYNHGFDGRTFLTESEWQTYCRRKPVRFIKKSREKICHVCGNPGTSSNPLQNAHVIGFGAGIIDLALTPDFLDSDNNIVTAHRISCNRTTELNIRNSMLHLKTLGITELPEYLPDYIREMWKVIP